MSPTSFIAFIKITMKFCGIFMKMQRGNRLTGEQQQHRGGRQQSGKFRLSNEPFQHSRDTWLWAAGEYTPGILARKGGEIPCPTLHFVADFR